MKDILVGGFGFFCGILICWPGVTNSESWKCVKELALDSTKQKTPLKAAFATPPQYFVKRQSYNGFMGRIRIVGDACFR